MPNTSRHLTSIVLSVCSVLTACSGQAETPRPNVLLIVADDLNCDSLGYMGGVAPEVTPNIDRLAAESYSFERAYGVASVCQPSRQAMLSGLYPFHYGAAGFFPMREGTPTLPLWLGQAGYLTGNIHKVHHMLPRESFNWDYTNKELGLKDPDGVVGRDPQAIARGLRTFIAEAEQRGKPFFMVVNSADPHRPFHGDPIRPGDFFFGYKEVTVREPSRLYRPDEVVVPPTLPDLPGVRADLAKYASSVRRLDDTVGACLQVLGDLGKEASTLVIFVSDNGMPLPFAKFDCYLGSNHSPLLMRWPEGIQAPKVDQQHLVSLMDITPTVLEFARLPVPAGLDGRSLVPLLAGGVPGDWRQSIVFIRNEDIYYGDGIRRAMERNPDFIAEIEARGWRPRPDHKDAGTYSRHKEMRCFFDGRFGYIYNNWYRPDGLEYSPLGAGVPYGDPALTAMKAAAAGDPLIRERYQFYLLRTPEELYDWSADPGSRHNLVSDPSHAEVLQAARTRLLQWMTDTGDPLRAQFRQVVE